MYFLNFISVINKSYFISGKISNGGEWPEVKVKLQDDTDKFVGTGPMCRYAEDLPLLVDILSGKRINFEKKVITAVIKKLFIT